jgi:uncharacterized membrane protein YadS
MIAMAALGLGVDIRVGARVEARVTHAVTVSLIVLVVMSYGTYSADGNALAGGTMPFVPKS